MDILHHVPAPTFDDAWSSRVTVAPDGGAVTFIGRDDLLANERAVGRPQDGRDARAVERAARPRGRGG